jgi:hypothetical protein
MKKRKCPSRITATTIQRERLRQARLLFNCQLVLTCICGVTALVGLFLLLTGRITPGLFTSIGGLAGTVNQVSCMTRDANDRLDNQFKRKPTQSKPRQRQIRKRSNDDKAA